MYAASAHSFWLALPLAPFAAGFLVRTFIVQHDCGHGSFFRSRRVNDALGWVCSLLTLAPYLSWRRQHAGHHGIWNNLDRRQSGADIYSSCLTLHEFHALPVWRQRWYRIVRNPLIANLILPPLVFIVLYRFPFDMPRSWASERRAVFVTDIGLVLLYGGLSALLGLGAVAMVQVTVMVVASISGVWLFTVQHRSDNTVWARQKDWNAVTASLKGSTYLRCHPILQWFSGNIGLHHIHHLNPRIPNYRLQKCHDSIAGLTDVPPVSLRSAFRSMFYVLWDEQRQRMVTFRDARAIRRPPRLGTL